MLSQKRPVLLVVAGIGCVWAVGYFLGSTSGSQQANTPARKLDEDLYSGVRLGMAIPYFGEKLPPGFVWADGVESFPDEDWVAKDCRGENKKVPNLNGRVMRGVTPGQKVGAVGGSDSHQHAVPDHDHTLPKTTGGIANDGVAHKGDYSVTTGASKTKKNEFLVTINPDGFPPGLNGNLPQGNHSHTLGGKTEGLVEKTYTTTDDRVAKEKANEQYVPSYVAVRYIIRIK